MPNQETSPNSHDFVFRYRLEQGECYRQHDPLAEMFKSQWENILNLTVPTLGDDNVTIDGFRLMCEPQTVREIFPSKTRNSNSGMNRLYQAATEHQVQRDTQQDDVNSSGAHSTTNAQLYEPRIDFIRKQLESLLSLVELEKDGEVVKVDGFRLKDPNDWLVPSNCRPEEVMEHLSTKCNCDCVFCYLKGNPPDFPLEQASNSPVEEFEEVKTRLKYFSPKSKLALPPSLGGIYESFAHPYFLESLYLVRQKTSMPLRLATNGETLTPEMISELSQLGPMYLYLSLNSSSPYRRKKLMRSRNPHVAIDALPILRDTGIPYAAVIVPWPIDSIEEMIDDLYSTVAYADQHGAHLVEVNLPGYSRYFSSETIFDLDEVWAKIVSCVRELRSHTTCPIVAMPMMYEENLYEQQKSLPKVIGLVKNSPAARSGLHQGDIIQSINGLTVRNRAQARDFLSALQRAGEGRSQINVRRGSSAVLLQLDLDDCAYPYSKDTDNHLGVVFLGTGLRMSHMENLKNVLETRGAKRVLFLSSALVKPTLEQYLTESYLFNDRDLNIDIVVPHNNFFGGNVFMGDLLVVQDFIDCIMDYLGQAAEIPDLVVIPSSPFSLGTWKRDLTGRVYLDIERETGVPVEILECMPIND